MIRIRTMVAGLTLATSAALIAPAAFAASPAPELSPSAPANAGGQGLLDQQAVDAKAPSASKKAAYLHLSKTSGQRKDPVSVEAFCPGGGDADLDSLALDDVKPMHADKNGILHTSTRVEKDAKFGSQRVQVLCKGGERPNQTFTVTK